MAVREYDADNSEVNEQPAQTRNDAPRWDGWGEPPMASQQCGELAQDGVETSEAQAATAKRGETAWDGWGDRPPNQRELVDTPKDGVPVDAERTKREFDDRPAARPDDEASPNPSERRDDAARARAAIDAAFQVSPDTPIESGETSAFKESVERSEAQHVESLSEAEDYARDAIGIERVDFSDFDQKTANEVNATLEVLRNKYPEVGGLEYLGTIQGRNADMKAEKPDLAADRVDVVAEPRSEVVAVTLRKTEDYNGITINREWSNRYDEASSAMRNDELSGGSAQGVGSMSGVVAHEFGHLVENHLRASGQFDGKLQGAVDELAGHDPAQLSAEISRYAVGNDCELFAEAFAEYQTSDHPRPAARTIGNIVDNILNVQDNGPG